ncbi:MAG: SLBB domain-containing protein [Flavobacteriaceae bacterium]|nr:SLBB domain-containing protein [Flavobacteriaceae bacterium]
MKKLITLLLLFVLLANTATIKAQISTSQVQSLNVDAMSDADIAKYWDQAKSQGYSLEELSIAARAKGVSAMQISKLKQRIRELGLKTTNQENSFEEKDSIVDFSYDVPFGLTGIESDNKKPKNELFGFDFFSNPKISFTPNINMATPENYQLGPGDELLIDVWGAAENTYEKIVNKQGAIRIENIGLIHVNGMSIKNATAKINSYLKRIYSGIGATKNSYNKVHTSIILKNIRTVQVNIIGEVKAPGTYSLNALSTVLNALYAAGGPTENGTFRNVKLIRGGQPLSSFDIYDFLITGTEKGNIQLRDQDVIIIGPYLNLVTIEGEVKRPGIYELKEGETMQDLLKYCSGFKPNAYTNLLTIERVNGRQKEVKELAINQHNSFLIKGGDKVVVETIIDKFSNRVSIGGAVYRPGNYEYQKGLDILTLINKADGIKKEAYLSRGIIIRTHDEATKETIAFSVTDILKKKSSIVLMPEDSIHVYDKIALRERQYVTINGAVNNPTTIDFMEGIKIEDLIAMAAGFTDGADANTIDISRRLKDGSFETISQNFKVKVQGDLSMSMSSSFVLKPFDIVSVRYLKGYSIQKKVQVLGEVNFPGDYAITNKNERISDLIRRAGDLSPYAYLKGATLIRKKQGVGDLQQLKFIQQISKKDTLLDDIKEVKEFKIGIDLETILKHKGEYLDADLVLNEGDVLMIPSVKQTIEVQGEVLSPSLVLFEENRGVKHYIESSGGFSGRARRNKIYVVYANGDIKTVSNFLFFRHYPKLEPGATILVPSRKPRGEGMSVQAILGITTSLATLGILINTLTK